MCRSVRARRLLLLLVVALAEGGRDVALGQAAAGELRQRRRPATEAGEAVVATLTASGPGGLRVAQPLRQFLHRGRRLLSLGLGRLLIATLTALAALAALAAGRRGQRRLARVAAPALA